MQNTNGKGIVFIFIWYLCSHLFSLWLPVFSTTCHHPHAPIHTWVAENNAKGAACSFGRMCNERGGFRIKPATITSLKLPPGPIRDCHWLSVVMSTPEYRLALNHTRRATFSVQNVSRLESTYYLCFLLKRTFSSG